MASIKPKKSPAESVDEKSPIAHLPSGVGVLKTVNGHGGEYWRVRLGKRFTGGAVQVMSDKFGSILARQLSRLASA